MSVKGGVHRAFRIAGVLVVAIALAACSRAQQQPKEYGVGGEGPIAPGTSRDFAVNVGDVVVTAEREWFTYGRVTEERGRVYLGSSTELLVACYLASQHAGGNARVWYADAAGTLTEYVYEVG